MSNYDEIVSVGDGDSVSRQDVSGEGESQEILHCKGRNTSSVSAYGYGPLTDGVLRLRGGADDDSFSDESSINFTTSESEMDNDLEIDDGTTKDDEIIDVACKDLLPSEEAASVDEEATLTIDSMEKEETVYPFVDIIAVAVDSMEKLEDLSKNQILIEKSPDLQAEAEQIVQNLKDKGYESIDILRAMQLKAEMDAVIAKVINQTATKQIKELGSYDKERTNMTPEDRAKYDKLKRDVKQADMSIKRSIERTSLLKASKSLKSGSSSSSLISLQCKEIRELENFNQVKSSISAKAASVSLENDLKQAEEFDKLVEQLEKADKARFEGIDKAAFWQYHQANRNNPNINSVSELLEHAFKNQLLQVVKYDSKVKNYSVNFDNNDKVVLKPLTQEQFYERNRKLDKEYKIQFVEKERIQNALSVLRGRIKDSEAKKEESRNKSKDIIKCLGSARAKGLLSKPTSRFDVANKKSVARDLGIKFKEDPFSAKIIERAGKEIESEKTKAAIKEVSNSTKLNEKQEKAAKEEAEKQVRKVTKALRSALIDANLSKDDKLNLPKEELQKVKTTMKAEYKNKSLKDAISRINAKSDKEDKTYSRVSKDLRAMASKKGSGASTVAPPGGKVLSKIGDHSVHINGVITVEFDAAHGNLGQSAFTWCRVRINDSRTRVSWNRNSFTWQITTRVHTPTSNMELRRFEYFHEWERFYAAGDEPFRTIIRHGDVIQKDTMEIASASEYIRERGVAYVKAISESLQSEFKIPKHIAEMLAPCFTENTRRYVNSALFTQMALLAMQISDIEQARVAWSFNQAALRAEVAHVNVQATANEVRDMVRVFEAANARGSFVFEAKYLTPAKMTILYALTHGMSSVDLTTQGIRHIFNTFDIECPSFMVIHEGPVPGDIALQRTVTSEAVWKFMFEIAGNFRMQADLVEGVINAVRIGYGNIVTQRDRGVYFTSTLEARMIVLPRPHYHNVLWRVLKKEPPEMPLPLLEADYVELSHMDVIDFQLGGALIAASMSASISTNLQRWNFTGTVINDINAREVVTRYAHAILDNAISIRQEMDRCALFVDMCSSVAQIFGFTINSNAFRNSAWSNGLNMGVRALGPDEMWMIRWANEVPYMFDPIVLLPYVQGMPEEWGLSLPLMGIDLSEESILSGQDDTLAWWAELGERGYDQVCTEENGARYVGYGAFVINFLLQHTPFRLNEPFAICFQSRSIKGSRAHTVAYLQGAHQPDIDMRIPHIRPGTLLTFDWVRMRQLVPYIRRDDLPDGIFEILGTTQSLRSEYAGIQCERAPIHHTISSAISYERMFPGMSNFNLSQGRGARSVGREEN